MPFSFAFAWLYALHVVRHSHNRLEEDAGNMRWEQIGQDIDGKAAGDGSAGSGQVSLLADGMTIAISSSFNSENGDFPVK